MTEPFDAGVGAEGPRFAYRPHVSNLLFWLLVTAVLWGGLALVIVSLDWGQINQMLNRMADNSHDTDNGPGWILIPLILAALALVLALVGPAGVISYFHRHRVEFAPTVLHFSGMWMFDESYVPYRMIERTRKTMLGGVEVRFRGESFGKLKEQRKTIYLSEREEFLAALRTACGNWQRHPVTW